MASSRRKKNEPQAAENGKLDDSLARIAIRPTVQAAATLQEYGVNVNLELLTFVNLKLHAFGKCNPK